jgi:hypothetical protein
MSMRQETNSERVRQFMRGLGEAVTGPGKAYFTGGVSAVLLGWRETTVDVDIKAEPEPRGFFEALPRLKNQLDINVEPACPSDFIPVLPGWQERSQFIERQGGVDFLHYDFYSQALAKIERWHARDREDVKQMIERRLVRPSRLWTLFEEIRPALIRYPAIDPASFEARAREVVSGSFPPL